MSEHNEELPLTRRERRLREMGETGAMDLSEVAGAPAEATPEAQPSASPSPVNAEDIEISPVNEDGTPRSRREMRQLREAALAELAASRPEAAPAAEPEAAPAAEPEAAPAAETAPAAEPEAVPAAEAAIVAEAVPASKPAVAAEPVTAAEPAAAAEPDVAAEPIVAAEPASAPDPEPYIPEPVPAPVPADTAPGAMPDFDTLIAPPTEPFTVDELREASRAAEQAADPAEPVLEAAPVEDLDTPAAPPVADAPAPAKAKRRFPWGRNKDADEPVAAAPEVAADPAEPGEPESADEPVSTADPAAPETIVIDEVEAVEVATETTEAGSAEPEAAVIEDLSVDAEVVEATPVDEPIIAEASDEPKPTPAAPKASEGYSFPDIVPPEEWRSVFDDPASRVAPADGSGSRASGDFDDLISRAVAQEGASGGANTSALILPSMPDDTGGLSGPLGGTGELYLTGSLELPKSLGETGGHSALHDSIEMDPIVGYDPAEAQVTADHGPAPVSARHAVSARVPASIPVVAKPTKERSKLPLVLSLTGGGLLVAVVALGVWGASNGMFG